MAVQSTKKPSALPHASLVPMGHHAGKPAIPLKKTVILVGSRSNAHLHLLSRHVSKAHALILSHAGSVYIRDLASREQIYVNGQAQREAWLEDGDLLKIGSFTFKYKDGPTVGQGAEGDVAPEPCVLEVAGADAPIAIAEKVVLIGRRPTCDISLLEASVSTAHAVIFHIDGKHYIRDLGSRTGTFVNGEKIHQSELAVGDNIRIGETDMTYALSRADDHAIAPVQLEAAPHDEIDELEDLVGTAPLDVAAEMGQHGGKLSPELEAELAAALGGVTEPVAKKKDEDLIPLELAHEEVAPPPLPKRTPPPPVPQPKPVLPEVHAGADELDLLPGGVEDLVELEPIDLSKDPDVSEVPPSSADTRAIGLDLDHEHEKPTISPQIVETTPDSELLLGQDLTPIEPEVHAGADSLEVTASDELIPLEAEPSATEDLSPRGGWSGMSRQEEEAAQAPLDSLPVEEVGEEDAVIPVEEVAAEQHEELLPVEEAVEEIPVEAVAPEAAPHVEVASHVEAAPLEIAHETPVEEELEEIPLDEVSPTVETSAPVAEEEAKIEPTIEVPASDEIPLEVAHVEQGEVSPVDEGAPLAQTAAVVEEVATPMATETAPVEELPAEKTSEAEWAEPVAIEPVTVSPLEAEVIAPSEETAPAEVGSVDQPATEEVIEVQAEVAPEAAAPVVESLVSEEPVVEAVAPGAPGVAEESIEVHADAGTVEQIVEPSVAEVPVEVEQFDEAFEGKHGEAEEAVAPVIEPIAEPVAQAEAEIAAPVETTPVETTPVETTPVETTPVETTPVETTPAVEPLVPEEPVAEVTPVEEAAAAVEPPAVETSLAGQTAPVPEPAVEEPEVLDDILEEIEPEPVAQEAEVVEEVAPVEEAVVAEEPQTIETKPEEDVVALAAAEIAAEAEATPPVVASENLATETVAPLSEDDLLEELEPVEVAPVEEVVAEAPVEATAAPVEPVPAAPVEELESVEILEEIPLDDTPVTAGEVGQTVEQSEPTATAPIEEPLEEVQVVEDVEQLEELEPLPEIETEARVDDMLPVLELDAADLRPVRQRDPESLVPLEQVDPEALDEVELIDATESEVHAVTHQEEPASADSLSDTAFGQQVAEFTSTSTGDIVEAIPAVQTRNLINQSTRIANELADIDAQLASALTDPGQANVDSELPATSATELADQSPVQPVETQETAGEVAMNVVTDEGLTSNLTGELPELEEMEVPTPAPGQPHQPFIGTDLSSFIGGMPLVLPDLAPPPTHFGQVQVAFEGSRTSLSEPARSAFPVGKALADEMEQAAAGLRDAEDLVAEEQAAEAAEALPPVAHDSSDDEGAPADEWNIEAVLDLEEHPAEELPQLVENVAPVDAVIEEPAVEELEPVAESTDEPAQASEDAQVVSEDELLDELEPLSAEEQTAASQHDLLDTPFGDQEAAAHELEVTAEEQVHQPSAGAPSMTEPAAPIVDESAVEPIHFGEPVAPAIPAKAPVSLTGAPTTPPRPAARRGAAAPVTEDAGADVIFGAMSDGRTNSPFGGGAVRDVDVFSGAAAMSGGAFGAVGGEEIPPMRTGPRNGDAAHEVEEEIAPRRGRVIVPPRLGVLGAGEAAVESMEAAPAYRTIHKKSTAKRLFVALVIMLLLIAGAIAAIFYFLKPKQTAEGTLHFDNVGALTTAQYKEFQNRQRELLGNQNVLLGARGMVAAQSISPGFLASPEQFGRLRDNWIEGKRNVMQIRWEGMGDDRDDKRMLAVLSAMYQENARETDRARRLKREVEDLDKRIAELKDLRNQRDQKMKVVASAPTDSDIAKLEEQLRQADAEFTKAHAAAQTARLELKKAEQQLPSPGEALLNKEDPKAVDPELALLQKTLEETAAKLLAAKSAASEEADQKRKSLDQAIEQFQQTANALAKENPQLAQYVAAVQQLQEKTHKLSGDLIEVQQQHHARLSDLKKKVDDLAQAQREKAWAVDKELADLRSRLDLAQRGYNALTGENYAVDSKEVKAALADIRDLTGKIEARKSALGDVAVDAVANDLVDLIKIARERLDSDRARIEKDIKDQEQAFAASGMIEKLPETQKVQAASLKARQEAINELRKEYGAALEKRTAENNAAIRDIEGQIASLTARIDERKRSVATAGAAKLTAEQEAARKAELEAKQAALKRADELLADAQKLYAQRDRELRSAMTRRDEVTIARRELEAITQTLGADAEADQRQNQAMLNLEDKKDELKKIVVAQAPTDDDVRVTSAKDDRMLFSAIAVGGFALLFGVLSIFLARGSHHTVERVIDDSTPPTARRAPIEQIETARPRRETSVL